MKISIYTDEAYPVYYVDEHAQIGTEVHVDGNTVKKWKRIQREYARMQFEMKVIERGHD